MEIHACFCPGIKLFTDSFTLVIHIQHNSAHPVFQEKKIKWLVKEQEESLENNPKLHGTSAFTSVWTDLIIRS